jgi:chemotaxis protein MotB
MKKKKHEGEHENGERWLLTYADLITLLLGLFVILYAMSKVDAGKYAEIAAALGGTFGASAGGKIAVIQGSAGVVPVPLPGKGAGQAEMVKHIQAALRPNIESGLINLSTNERGVTVRVMEELGFASASAEPKPAMLRLLDSLAGILKNLPYEVRVEGHTDNVPINTAVFRSNWDLSVSRSVNTAYYLIGQHGLLPARVSVAGYGEFRPLVPNTSEENRARNRRVDIVIMSGDDIKPPR